MQLIHLHVTASGVMAHQLLLHAGTTPATGLYLSGLALYQLPCQERLPVYHCHHWFCPVEPHCCGLHAPGAADHHRHFVLRLLCALCSISADRCEQCTSCGDFQGQAHHCL